MNNNYFQIKKIENVVFFGTSVIFEKLVKINKDLGINSEIITSKDQSKNISKNISYKTFKKLNKNFEKYISKKYVAKKTLFFSLGSRWIFSGKIIKNFKGNLVNFHGARLPQDAGGGSFSWRIMKNDRINLLLIHKITKQIDKGPILIYEEKLFPKSCKLPIDFKINCDEGFLSLYKKFIEDVQKEKKFYFTNQPQYLSSYYPRLDSRSDSWLDWSMTANEIERFIDAFDDPFKGCLTKIGDKTVRLKKAQLHSGENVSHKYMKGLIIRNDNGWVVVSVDDKNYLLIEEIFDNKGKIITSKLKPGDRFFTPQKYLEKQFSSRTKFKASGKLK